MAHGPDRRFFFALLTLLRFSVNLGVIERPLVLGLAWGAATGQWHLAVGVSLFFELLWLDHFPAGTFIPPNALLSTLLVLFWAGSMGMESAGSLVIPLMCAIPLAHAGSRVELLQRRWQDKAYNRLLRWARKGERKDGRPERLLAVSLLQTAGINFLLFGASFLVFRRVFTGMRNHWPGFFEASNLSWEHLWLMAALGGLLSLRRRKSYMLLAAGILILGIAGFFITL